ncbi:MAG: uncharacterized protein A8A55_1427 [Amphiamblys sp. WSBS2006]|nr:MAG: uncharacterized protein A8A55_1427 [Amphiamblys sp. WSBS2006]
MLTSETINSDIEKLLQNTTFLLGMFLLGVVFLLAGNTIKRVFIGFCCFGCCYELLINFATFVPFSEEITSKNPKVVSMVFCFISAVAGVFMGIVLKHAMLVAGCYGGYIFGMFVTNTVNFEETFPDQKYLGVIALLLFVGAGCYFGYLAHNLLVLVLSAFVGSLFITIAVDSYLIKKNYYRLFGKLLLNLAKKETRGKTVGEIKALTGMEIMATYGAHIALFVSGLVFQLFSEGFSEESTGKKREKMRAVV